MTAEKEEIKKHVDEIVKNTFKRLQYAYLRSKPEEYEKRKDIKNHNNTYRLIFPKYRHDEEGHRKDDLRISEQELRFAFTEEFIRYCNPQGGKPKTWNSNVETWRYSIETPTEKKYKNFSKGEPSVAINNEGRSALFDFVIHDEKNTPICLIEFKAHNPEQRKYHKDFVKLIHDAEESNILRYFIQVLVSYDEKTIMNLARNLINTKSI